jgi:hypothetical protein
MSPCHAVATSGSGVPADRHLLAVDDGVVVTGVDHAWRAGPEACRLNIMTVGAPNV